MTKSRCICTYGIDMAEYAKLFTYAPLSETTCAVTGCRTADPVSLLIPAHDPEGRTVVAVGDRAFAGRSSLRAVTLPRLGGVHRRPRLCSLHGASGSAHFLREPLGLHREPRVYGL